VYDTAARLREKRSGSSVESYVNDEGTYGKGRLSGVSNAAASITYAYTSAGELKSQAQTNTDGGQTFVMQWGYDTGGKVTSTRYPSGLTLGLGYDTHGRLTAITSNLGGAGATLAGNILYQPGTTCGASTPRGARRCAWSTT
jgi:YD repeat-containing protein